MTTSGAVAGAVSRAASQTTAGSRRQIPATDAATISPVIRSTQPLQLCHDGGEVHVAVPLTASIPVGFGIVVWELPGEAMALSGIRRGDYRALPATYDTLTRDMSGWELRRSGPLQILHHRFGACCDGYDLAWANLAAHAGAFDYRPA